MDGIIECFLHSKHCWSWFDSIRLFSFAISLDYDTLVYLLLLYKWRSCTYSNPVSISLLVSVNLPCGPMYVIYKPFGSIRLSVLSDFNSL